MENLTNEQIEVINAMFETMGEWELSEEEMKEFKTIEDKFEYVWSYYDCESCARVGMRTKQDLLRWINKSLAISQKENMGHL